MQLENLALAQKLINELRDLESAHDVLLNYDVSISVTFHTTYNHNRKDSKSVSLPLPSELRAQIENHIITRTKEVKEKLSML